MRLAGFGTDGGHRRISVVSHALEILCRVRTTQHQAVVEFGENYLTGPSSIESALRFIASHGRFAVSEFVFSRPIELVSRLVSEGLLDVVPHPDELVGRRTG